MTLRHALFGGVLGGGLPLAAAQVPTVGGEPWWFKYAISVTLALAGFLFPLAQRYLAYRRQLRAAARRDAAAKLQQREDTDEIEVAKLLEAARRDEAMARVLDPPRKVS